MDIRDLLICNKCGEQKNISLFVKNRRVCKKCKNTYLSLWVKTPKGRECQRRYYHVKGKERRELKTVKASIRKIRSKHRLKKQYGLTPDQYNEMLLKQDSKCKICYRKETAVSGKQRTVRSLAVDHSHITGKNRALLCAECNLTLGKFNTIAKLENALNYLKEFGE